MLKTLSDPWFFVEILNAPVNEDFLMSAIVPPKYSLESLLDSGDFSLLEIASLTFNCKGFPHNVPMQLRTHRHQITFDVQSQRYTSERSLEVANGTKSVSEVFYVRDDMPHKEAVYAGIVKQTLMFQRLLDEGYPAESARDILPQGIRQNFIFSCTLRTLLHILDLRFKPDAQAEIRTLSQMLITETSKVFPRTINWYSNNRSQKGILAP